VYREAEGVHVARKSYAKPECVSRSASQTAHLLHDRISQKGAPPRRGSPTVEALTPILLVRGYRGDAKSIQDAAWNRNLNGHSYAVPSGAELTHMLCKDLEWNGAARPDFFLLDLRLHAGASSDVVRNIRTESRLGDIPLAILAGEGSAGELSEDCSARHIWRVSGLSDPVQLVEALLAVLHLWVEMLEPSPSSAF